MLKISVVICAHNPQLVTFNRVLNSLKQQTLAPQHWELIIVDNNSSNPIKDIVDIAWHPEACVVVEKQLGLVHARIKGTLAAKYEILVTVDDDTPLFADYLENVSRIYQQYPELGVIGGKSIAEYETTPPVWFDEFKGLLAIRDLGDEAIIESLNGDQLNSYPRCAPLLIAPRRSCMLAYIEHYNANEQTHQLGRKGTDLSSGEDNDINLFIYKNGYALGYFPELKFIHIIPKNRYTPAYLKRMSYKSNISWIKVLTMHNINPHHKIPKWTLIPRQLKAWFKLGAWKNEASNIRWQGARGTFKGLSEI